MKRAPKNGICPNCHVGSGFSSESMRIVWPAHEPNEYYKYKDKKRVQAEVTVCLHCEETSTYLVFEEKTDLPGPTWKTTDLRLVFPEPPPREISEHVIAEVRSLFIEASVCEQAGALRAAAAMYRATVEAICDEQGIEAGKLYDRINALKDKNIAEEIVNDLHEARLLGNYSLHRGVDFSVEEVADVADLISEAVVTLYVQPEERKRMRESRNTRRKASESK